MTEKFRARTIVQIVFGTPSSICMQIRLDQWFSNCGTRTTNGTRAAFLPYSKSFVNLFLCYNSLVCYANVANLFICYINLKYIGVNYVLLKPGVYTPTLKKHQVVHGLKKFENHWVRLCRNAKLIQ